MSYDEALHGESASGFQNFETVKIPDLFLSFVAQPVPVNPLYEQAFAESAIWFADIGVNELGDSSIYQYLRDINAALWGAMAVPKAGYETLRTYIDWLNWVFIFDDKFDTGSMDNDQIGAKELLQSLLANMKGQMWEGKKHPWVKVHDAIWARVKARAPERVSHRYLQMTEKYCHGVWDQIEANTKNQLSTVEERVIRSRGSSATMQTFNLVAYAYGIDLPDEVYDSPEFTRLRELSSDIIVLVTDVVSYIKEQTEGLNNNVISICRMKGMSAQEAHDYIGELIKEKYQEWYMARAQIPIMGEAMDFEVERYIQGIVTCSLASTHSVFDSKRYFGSRAADVRKTRIISVFPEDYYVERRQQFSLAGQTGSVEIEISKAVDGEVVIVNGEVVNGEVVNEETVNREIETAQAKDGMMENEDLGNVEDKVQDESIPRSGGSDSDVTIAVSKEKLVVKCCEKVLIRACGKEGDFIDVSSEMGEKEMNSERGVGEKET